MGPLRRLNLSLLFILVLAAVCIWVVAQTNIHLGDFRREGMRLGLDLRGGSHLVLQADLSQASNPVEALGGAKEVIERRVNALGLTEPVVQTQGEDRILVQLPGVGAREARELIGATAQLDFREVPTGASDFVPATAAGDDGLPKRLTGEYLKPNSFVSLNTTTNLPVVNFEFNPEGGRLFKQVTRMIFSLINELVKIIKARHLRKSVQEKVLINMQKFVEFRILYPLIQPQRGVPQ